MYVLVWLVGMERIAINVSLNLRNESINYMKIHLFVAICSTPCVNGNCTLPNYCTYVFQKSFIPIDWTDVFKILTEFDPTKHRHIKGRIFNAKAGEIYIFFNQDLPVQI